MVVFFMGFQMLSEVGDTLCQKSDLNFRRAGIYLVAFEFLDSVLFVFNGNIQFGLLKDRFYF
jgi:hypothetical protein